MGFIFAINKAFCSVYVMQRT